MLGSFRDGSGVYVIFIERCPSLTVFISYHNRLPYFSCGIVYVFNVIPDYNNLYSSAVLDCLLHTARHIQCNIILIY